MNPTHLSLVTSVLWSSRLCSEMWVSEYPPLLWVSYSSLLFFSRLWLRWMMQRWQIPGRADQGFFCSVLCCAALMMKTSQLIFCLWTSPARPRTTVPLRSATLVTVAYFLGEEAQIGTYLTECSAADNSTIRQRYHSCGSGHHIPFLYVFPASRLWALCPDRNS